MIDTEGKSFPEILKEQVLDPLDMLNSSFNQPLDSTQLQYAATGYLPDGSMTKGKRHTYPEMAAAGLWTNAEDLAKFAINIQKTLAGDTIKALSKESTIAMLTPFVEDNVGLGIFLSNKKDEIYFGHGGWNEGFSSDLVAHKDKGYGAVIMINSNHPEFIDELMRSVALSYNWDNYFPNYNKLDKPGELDSKLIGKYLVGGYDFIELKEENGQLMYKDGPEFDFTDFVKVSDSTYAVRDFNVLFQFKENADQDTFNMHILNPNTMETRSVYHQVNSDETLPLEILMKGDFDQTLKSFEAL